MASSGLKVNTSQKRVSSKDCTAKNTLNRRQFSAGCEAVLHPQERDAFEN